MMIPWRNEINIVTTSFAIRGYCFTNQFKNLLKNVIMHESHTMCSTCRFQTSCLKIDVLMLANKTGNLVPRLF